MIESLRPGEPLPNQPVHPLGLRDRATFAEFTINPGWAERLWNVCMLSPDRSHTSGKPAFGWAQAGKQMPFIFISKPTT